MSSMWAMASNRRVIVWTCCLLLVAGGVLLGLKELIVYSYMQDHNPRIVRALPWLFKGEVRKLLRSNSPEDVHEGLWMFGDLGDPNLIADALPHADSESDRVKGRFPLAVSLFLHSADGNAERLETITLRYLEMLDRLPIRDRDYALLAVLNAGVHTRSLDHLALAAAEGGERVKHACIGYLVTNRPDGYQDTLERLMHEANKGVAVHSAIALLLAGRDSSEVVQLAAQVDTLSQKDILINLDWLREAYHNRTWQMGLTPEMWEEVKKHAVRTTRHEPAGTPVPSLGGQ